MYFLFHCVLLFCYSLTIQNMKGVFKAQLFKFSISSTFSKLIHCYISNRYEKKQLEMN